LHALQARKTLLDTCLLLIESWRARKAAEEAALGAAGSGDAAAPAAAAAAGEVRAGGGGGQVAAGSFLDLLLSAHARGTGERLTDEQVRLERPQQRAG
jgi:hypothetical protein